MNPEGVPLIKSLNAYAEKLSPEHRSELYRFAESFLCVGVKNGIFIGALDALGTKSENDDQKKWIEYLTKKREENRVG